MTSSQIWKIVTLTLIKSSAAQKIVWRKSKEFFSVGTGTHKEGEKKYDSKTKPNGNRWKKSKKILFYYKLTNDYVFTPSIY